MLDVNQSCTVSKLEFKTGIQQLGLHATPEESESLWSSIYRPVDSVRHERGGAGGRRN